MRKILSWFLLFFLALVAPVPSASAHCSPPCGPISVDLSIDVGKFRGLMWGNETEIVKTGLVSFYIDVDTNGFWFDPDNKPKITVRVNKQVPWVETTIEPSEFEVPIDDPTYLGFENGQPGTQTQYLWTAPITVTMKKLRDPDPVTEFGDDPYYVKTDGTYRVSISAISTGSYAAQPALGTQWGIQEGYGSREFRFVPEVGGVQWHRDDEGALRPDIEGPAPDVNTHSEGGALPSVAIPVFLVVLFAVVALARRRFL